MFVLIQFSQDQVEDSMHLCGAYDSHDKAVEHMVANYDNVKSAYEIENPFDSWEFDEVFGDEALLKVEATPYVWVWKVFDTDLHETIYF